MAFTTPKTWSFGEILTSTDMNTYVRDNTVALRALGIGSNIVQTVKTNTFTESVATGATSGDVTGLTVTITPESASNKVLIIASINCAAANPFIPYVILYRAGSILSAAVGDAASSRPVVTSASTNAVTTASQTVPVMFLDSPSTAAATTYSIRLRHGDQTSTRDVYVNRSQNDNDDARGGRSISTITAIEVAA